MRIVILSTRSPEPADSGVRIRLASIVAALKKNHDVRLVLLGDASEDDLQRVRGSGVSVERLPHPDWDTLGLRRRILHNVAALIHGTTPLFESVDSPVTRALVTRAAASADVVIIDMTSLAPYAALLRQVCPQVKIVINTHNVDSQLFSRLAATGNPVARVHKRLLASGAARIEASFHRDADAVLAVSEEDRRKLEDVNRGRIPVYVLPNAVDTQRLLPLPYPHGRTVLFCGVLNYQPNAEGIRWFVDRVLPEVKLRIPEARLLIVGRRPTEEISRYAERAGIEVAADVEDVQPFYARSRLAIVPLLRGGGTRLKILEALALGRPVVSTSMGAEGVGPTAGLVLADTPLEFADQVIALLQTGTAELSAAGVRYVEENYSWQALGPRLDDILTRLMT